MSETQITKCYRKSQHLDLSVEQQNAIPLVLSGKSDREIAEAVGVARETVTRWRNSDPLFISSVNYERRVLWDFGRDKVLTLQRKALDVLEKALDVNDINAALAFLKMSNCTDVKYDDWESDDNPDSVLMHLCMQEAQEQYLEDKREKHAETDENGRMSFLLDADAKKYLRACRLYRAKRGISKENAEGVRTFQASLKRIGAQREQAANAKAETSNGGDTSKCK